ncbi:MAG: FGGY family carbohydrate kinase [Gammaproteobacteria bacterium]
MPHKTPLFLALDQGGHASRALVFNAKGKLIASAQKTIATLHPGRDRVEHDPKALIASLRQVCNVIARKLGPRCAHIQAAGLATQRSTIVCWNRETGKALSPVISWQDRRAARHITALACHETRVHDLTGLVLSPHYGASKLAWCLENLNPVRKALRQERLAAGPLVSFILANLLEEKPLLADPVNASRSLLWDYRSRDWSDELLRLFRIPDGILPQCVPNRHSFGHLRLGNREIPLTVVTGDQPAALFAGGKPDNGSVYVNLGTGAFIQRLHGNTPPQVPGMLGSVLWQEQGRALYVLEGTVNGAGSALTWLRERLEMSEKKMFAAMPVALAPKSDVPLFLNGISGLGSPYWAPSFRSRFVGRGSPMQKMQAVVESVVFLLCINLARMQNTSAKPRRIVASGGLAKWDGLCQRLADLSTLPVQRPALQEATASGLAWLLGARPRTAIPAKVFKSNKNLLLENRYRRWYEAMQAALSQ